MKSQSLNLNCFLEQIFNFQAMFGALRVLNADQAKALLKFIRYQHSLAPSITAHKTVQSYVHQPGNIPFVSLALRSLISLSQLTVFLSVIS